MTRRSARIVARSTGLMRTLTGVVGLIEVNGEERCGGAVANRKEKPQDASMRSMRQRMMMKTIRKSKMRRVRS